MEEDIWYLKGLKMEKSELKEVLKPLIKECIKEVIFEDGTLSGIITEVAKGLAGVNVSKPQQITEKKVIKSSAPSQAVLQARKDLEETKNKLQSSTGLKGIFEGTTPMRSGGGGNFLRSNIGPLSISSSKNKDDAPILLSTIKL